MVPLSDREREQFRQLEFSDADFMRQIGVDAVTGEEGFTTLERRWARPTYDINGLTSGYQGEGAKTVLPAKASAKFSFRLVPKQDPKKDRRGARSKCSTSSARRASSMELVDCHGRRRRRAAGKPVHGRGRAGDRAGFRPGARFSFAKGARSRS